MRDPAFYEGPASTRVHRDPLSVGIAVLSAAEAISGVAIGFEAAATVGSIVIGGAVLGANFALNSMLAQKPNNGDFGGGINAPEVRGNIRQSAPAQRIIYGQTRVGGAVFFLNTDTPPYLYLGLLLSVRRISRILGLRIGENGIAFSSLSNNTIAQPNPFDGQYYISGGTSRLLCCFRDGSTSQPIDTLLHTYFPSLDTSFRQRGIATATFRFTYGADRNDFERMWGQVSVPSPLVNVQGAAVYDPRDATQSVDDETTWRYSNNAALVQADWLRQSYGVNFPADRIDWDRIATAADYDDELVGNADGTMSKRHTINGVVTLDQKPRTVMESLLTANRGFVVQSRGRGWVASSTPREATATIHDAIIIGGFELRDDKAKRDTVNTVRTRFGASDREYQEIDGPVLQRDDLITNDEEQLDITVRLPFTTDYRAAQRLAKQYLDESRLPRALTCLVKITSKTLKIEIGDCVNVDFAAPFTRANTTYTVEDYAILADFSGIQLSLTEYDASIASDWTPAEDEQPFTLPALTLS